MRAAVFFLASALSAALASPVPAPVPQDAGAGECTAEPLTPETWESLGIETFLVDFTANNLTAADGNGVQNLAASFGAPNFFCGLDAFCNAGQPCSPVKLPEWYVLVAMQNWNSYMNQLFTALIATSNIMSLRLPALVSDLNPKPRDDITPLKTMTRVFAGALSIIPFTGAVKTAANSIASTSTFISTNLQVPTPPDEFLQWTNMANSMSKMVEAWQASLSNSIQATLDAAPGAAGAGITELIRDGKFLGAHRNVTQAELQSNILRSMELYTIGLLLQSAGVFVVKVPDVTRCDDSDAHTMCVTESNGSLSRYFVTKRDRQDNAKSQKDLVSKLIDSYGMTKEQIMKDAFDCFVSAERQQGVYPFGDMLPVDPATKCIFMVNVCDFVPEVTKGVVEVCRDKGVGVDAGGPQ